MTDEQRKQLAELTANKREFKKKAEIERIKTQMSAEIERFEQHYEFADTETTKRIIDFIDKLPFCRPACVDLEKFSTRRKCSPRELRIEDVWICFLLGDEELFKIFVKASIADFFADFDEWAFYSPYLLLIYNDFGRFIFIDDNEKMTEVIL